MTPTLATTNDQLVARARQDWITHTAHRIWRETFEIVPAAVAQLVLHTSWEYDDQTGGTYESYDAIDLYDADENVIDDDTLPALIGRGHEDGELAAQWLHQELIYSRYPSAADLGEMFPRGHAGETIEISRDWFRSPDPQIPVLTRNGLCELDPHATPVVFVDSTGRRWEVLLVTARDGVGQED